MCTKVENIPTLSNGNLNLYFILRPLYAILSLLGLFPFGIRFQKHRFHVVPRSIYVSSLCAVSNMLFIYTFYFAHCHDLYSTSEKSLLSNGVLTQINYALELTTIMIFCTSAYVTAFIYKDTYVLILNSVSTLLVEMPDEIKKSLQQQLKLQVRMIIAFLLFITVLKLSVNTSRGDSAWKIILVTFGFLYPQMIQFTWLSFFFIIIKMLVMILKGIDRQTAGFWKEMYVHKTTVGKVVFTIEKKTSTSLRKMERHYTKAYQIKKLISMAFQGPILMTAIQAFHSIVSESYIIYHMMHFEFEVHPLVNCSLWINYQILKIFILAYSGTILQEQALQISKSLLSEPTEKLDLRMLMEEQHFATLMKSQRFELIVYGFFNLDATLIFKIVATASMYLIILVQFDSKN